MTILKTVEAVRASESSADLLETYNNLTGATLKRFASVAAGQRRCEMAMLAAKDADAQTGLPAGTDPQPRPRAEIVAKAKKKGLPLPRSLDEEVEFQDGTLGAELEQQAKTATPIVPRPPRDPSAPKATRKVMYAVQATFAGKSKPQAGSLRSNILVRIQGEKNSAALVSELDAHFETDTRGYINKLIEMEHLVVLDEDGFKKAKPVKK